MGASKRYKGKDCSYCGKPGSSSTNDHVVAKMFFLDSERNSHLELPQVPACASCNLEKSKLENYVGSALLIGSQHPEGNRYRQEKVAPRLEKNRKLRNALDIDAPPQWVMVNGVLQQMHVVKIDAKQTNCLLGMIVRGLYRYHYGKVLPAEMAPDVTMFRPENEAVMWSAVSAYFPPGGVADNPNSRPRELLIYMRTKPCARRSHCVGNCHSRQHSAPWKRRVCRSLVVHHKADA